MKYSILFPLIYLFIPTTILAKSEQCLCVFLKSGTQISLPVSEQPKIAFDGTVMRVSNGDYQIENVRKWMVGDPETIFQGIEGVQKPNKLSYKEGMLTVGTIKDVHVYNAAGIEMPVSVKNGQVDIRALPGDIYLIKAGSETLKIRKP